MLRRAGVSANMVGQRHNLLGRGFRLTATLCLLALLASRARVAIAQGWRSPWRTFTTADGLASDTVTAIYQAQDGALWFGTMQGVSRYNGEWQTYTTADGVADNEVTAIFQDKEGKVWVGTRGGLCRYDGRWVPLSASEGLGMRDVSTIGQLEDDSLWFGTLDRGISRLQAGEWRTFTAADGLPSNCITSLTQGEGGSIWVGTPLGLAYYDGYTWEVYTTDEGLPDNMITAILAAEDGALWVGTLKGVSHFVPNGGDSGRWEVFLPQDGLAGEHVTALLKDSEGILWVCTTEGVSLYDGQQWRTWTERDGLASSDVRAIFQDSDGGLWLGTTGGVSYCNSNWRLSSLPRGEGGESAVSYEVSALAQGRDGALWIATLGGGVIQYQGGQWHTYTLADGLADDNVFALAEDPWGALWFGTAGGVSRYLAGSWEVFTTTAGLPTDVVLSVAVAGDGTLWFGTAGGGVACYQPDDGWHTFTQSDGLADNYVRAIAEAQDGALWLGTSKGVNRFDGHSWEAFTSQSTNGGLPGDEVRQICCAPDGSLWFATNLGAARYDGASWQAYGKEGGLPINSVNTVWKGEGSDVWFGTSGGLCRYDGRTWKTYVSGQHLPSSHVLSILQSAPDTWWIGTTGGGLARYRPNQAPPWVRVASINERPVVTDTLVLPAEESNVVISFVGGDISTAPEQLLYMHRMEGVSEDWTYGRERFGLYSDLTPGTYRFWLMARDEDFNYSEPYSVAIAIPPRAYVPAPMLMPSATRVGMPVRVSRPPPSEPGLPWRYGWLAVPLLAAVGVGYWGYGRWQTRQAIGRGFNPYICGPPIHNEDMFFGREDLLHEILQIVHNNNIIIYGERRIGKTTLLYQLAQRLKKLEDPVYAFFPAFINLQGIPQDRLFLLMAQRVAQEVEDEVGSLGLICRSRRPVLAGRRVSSRGQEYNSFDFQEDLAVIVNALQATTSKEVRLVLLVDEADIISAYDDTVQEQLRGTLMSSIAQHVKVVLAGTYISKEWHLQSSPWYNLFSREIMLPLLSEEEVEKLIRRPVQGIYDYDQEATDRIITYSDLKPFEAQKLCLHAVKEMLERKKRCVTASEVEAALRSTLEERALEFEQIWGSMSSTGQRALRVLVSNMPQAAPVQAQGDRREQTLPRLPLSDGDRKLLMEGGVVYRYQKREYLLTSFQEWIRRESP